MAMASRPRMSMVVPRLRAEAAISWTWSGAPVTAGLPREDRFPPGAEANGGPDAEEAERWEGSGSGWVPGGSGPPPVVDFTESMSARTSAAA